MTHKGSIRVARKMLDHPIVGMRHPDRMAAWLWMLCEARYAPGKIEVKGKVIELQRGQFTSSVRFMAEKCGWSKSAFDRFMTRLKTGTDGEPLIETDTGTGQLIVTICNYDDYQADVKNAGQEAGQEAGQLVGQERDSSGTNNNKGNKINKDSKPPIIPLGGGCESDPVPKKNTRGTRLPEDWALPRDWGLWAVKEGMSEADVRREADNFRDYWISVPGQKGRKANWQATWRNRVREVIRRKPNGYGRPSEADRDASFVQSVLGGGR